MNSGISLLAKMPFFNDATITSSLHSVVQVLMGYFTIFQSHGLSGWFLPKIVKSCLNLSQLQPEILSVLYFKLSQKLWATK